MKTKEEILAKIENLMQEMQQLHNEVAALELVDPVVQDTVENVDKMDELACQYMQEEADSTPVIEDEVEDITLPDPPAEVHIDIPEEEDNDAIIGCQILTKFSGFYSGQCRVLGVRLKYNSDYIGKVNPKNGKVNTKYMVYKDSVILIAKAFDGKVLGTKQVAWNSLYTWHSILRERGLLNYKKNDKWLPSTILFDLD